ncbi:hypothetical protein N9B82_00515 [Saprospiraceae bacterium]|nr:hypothetical protein [Saprospiraceae bacterium]
MRTKLTILLSCIVILTSCSSKSETKVSDLPLLKDPNGIEYENTEEIPSQNAALLAKSRVFKRGFADHDFRFAIEVKQGEVSSLDIKSDGLETEYSAHFDLEAQIADAYFMDLDGNSHKELYIITKGTDDSGNLDIMGIATNGGDKSASEINIRENEELRKLNTDKVYVKNNQLFRSFETVKGRKKTFSYKLSKGENSMVLEPVELENM